MTVPLLVFGTTTDTLEMLPSLMDRVAVDGACEVGRG